MDFAFDATTLELRERLLAFMEECVYPAEQRFREEVEQADDRWGTPPVIEALKAQARERGLWNLFLPPIHEHGARRPSAPSAARGPRSAAGGCPPGSPRL